MLEQEARMQNRGTRSAKPWHALKPSFVSGYQHSGSQSCSNQVWSEPCEPGKKVQHSSPSILDLPGRLEDSLNKIDTTSGLKQILFGVIGFRVTFFVGGQLGPCQMRRCKPPTCSNATVVCPQPLSKAAGGGANPTDFWCHKVGPCHLDSTKPPRASRAPFVETPAPTKPIALKPKSSASGRDILDPWKPLVKSCERTGSWH